MKWYEVQLFFGAAPYPKNRQAIQRLKALDLGRLNMQFQQDWPRDKKITALLIFCRKTEKFRSTELYGAPLEGSTKSQLHMPYVNGKLSIS